MKLRRKAVLAAMFLAASAAGVRAAYGDHLGRLIAFKDRYDPANVFRLNANILPNDAAGRRR